MRWLFSNRRGNMTGGGSISRQNISLRDAVGVIKGKIKIQDMDLPLVRRASKSMSRTAEKEAEKKVSKAAFSDWQKEKRQAEKQATANRNKRVTEMYLELVKRGTRLTAEEREELNALYYDLRVQAPSYSEYERLLTELGEEKKENSRIWTDIYGVLSGREFASARNERLEDNRQYGRVEAARCKGAEDVCRKQGPMAEVEYNVETLKGKQGELEYLRFVNSATRGKYARVLRKAEIMHKEFDEFCEKMRGVKGVKILNKYAYDPKKPSDMAAHEIVPIPITWCGRKMRDCMYYLAVEPDSEFWQMYKVGSKNANLPYVVESELSSKGVKQYRHQTERYYRGDRADAARENLDREFKKKKPAVEEEYDVADDGIPGTWVSFGDSRGAPIRDGDGKKVKPIFMPAEVDGKKTDNGEQFGE